MGLVCIDWFIFRVRFRLDESGDVTWTVSEELKSIPLFSCETYDVYNTSVMGAVVGFGAYAGHVIEFRVSLTYTPPPSTF